MPTVGIDIGSAAVKIAFVKDSRMLWFKTRPAAYQNADICEKLFQEGLSALSLSESDITGIAAAGYGRNLFKRASKLVNEISANAAGAWVLSGKTARSIVNVGGQDLKIIRIGPAGKALDFKMNDKCAAGTGRFFEMAERILGIPLNEFGDLCLKSKVPMEISSTCAVFAETEIISLMSVGKDCNDIIAGIVKSIAGRLAHLCENMDLEDEIFLDGGPALNKGLRLYLAGELGRTVSVLPAPQFTVAFGAAVLLEHKS